MGQSSRDGSAFSLRFLLFLSLFVWPEQPSLAAAPQPCHGGTLEHTQASDALPVPPTAPERPQTSAAPDRKDRADSAPHAAAGLTAKKKLAKKFRPDANPAPPDFAAPWAPPAVDDAVPPVAADVPCAAPEILEAAARRVKELVANLEEFTATERVEHSKLDGKGKARAPETRSYNYLVSFHEVRPGMLSVEETRNGSLLPDSFPERLATTGLPALVLVVHPYFVEDFDIACEGLGQWRGRPAWQVHFQQRADRPVRVRSYRVSHRRFPIRLKGRAWIAQDTHQVVRLETDLLEPVPLIRLQQEHMAIEYRPVEFPRRKLRLWLPHSVDLWVDFRGRRYHRRHSFRDFQLFSVETSQQIHDPVQPQ